MIFNVTNTETGSKEYRKAWNITVNKEFFDALELLEKERGIPTEYMFEKIEAALVTAFKKEYGSGAAARVLIDPVKKDVKVYRQYTVVEEVVNPLAELTLEQAKVFSKRATIGKIIESEIKPKEISRISAGIGKQIITQGIREEERRMMQEAYENKREEVVLATVSKIDLESGNIVIETETGSAVLLKNEQIPGETFSVGETIMVYIQEVNREARGPLVTLSRVHPGFIRRMFELEIPEIKEGIVVIKGIAREAGSRTKVSVMSRDEDVDPVGTCIGNHGMRINAILRELGGEKIDIVRYSENSEEYVCSALAPASVVGIEMLGERSCRVTVLPEQLSLAIGKEGQNARLAARLTGMKIDIKAQ